MPFTKIYNKDFFIKDNRIVLSKEYLQANRKRFKKITGSRFASILNQSNYVSAVKTWAMMVNIYTEPMEELFANAGNIIEPKIKDWVCQKTGINYKQYNPSSIGYDVFKDNEIFGGIPDGEPIDSSGNLLYPKEPILEIKTSSIDSFVFRKINNQFVLQKNIDGSPCVKIPNEKRLKWFKNNDIVIPSEYMYQLGLYCYLRNVNKGIFAICFLETSDYIKPNECNINDREIRLVDFEINLNEFKKNIEYGNKWYKNFIETGMSPKLTKEDREWFNAEANNE